MNVPAFIYIVFVVSTVIVTLLAIRGVIRLFKTRNNMADPLVIGQRNAILDLQSQLKQKDMLVRKINADHEKGRDILLAEANKTIEALHAEIKALKNGLRVAENRLATIAGYHSETGTERDRLREFIAQSLVDAQNHVIDENWVSKAATLLHEIP